MSDDQDLRAHIERLESEAWPGEPFAIGLYEDLERRRRAALSPWHGIRLFAAPLAAAAVIAGVVLAMIVARPQPDVAVSPSPSDVAVTSQTPSPTPDPTSSPRPTASPRPTPSAAPSPPPATPTPRVTPTPTPENVVGGTWSAHPPVPATDANRVSDVEIGASNLIYAIFEGQNGTMAAYDPAVGWTLVATDGQLPYGVSTDAQLVKGPDGALYLFMWGAEYTDVFAYDAASQSWGPEPAFQLDGETVLDAAAGSDGRLYFVSGPAGGPTRMLALDPADGSVTPLASEAGQYGPAIEPGPDGRLYVYGESGLASYDPASDTWRRESEEVLTSLMGPYQFAGGYGPYLYLVAANGLESDGPVALVAWDTSSREWLDVPPVEPAMESALLVIGPSERVYAIDSRSGPGISRAMTAFTPD